MTGRPASRFGADSWIGSQSVGEASPAPGLNSRRSDPAHPIWPAWMQGSPAALLRRESSTARHETSEACLPGLFLFFKKYVQDPRARKGEHLPCIAWRSATRSLQCFHALQIGHLQSYAKLAQDWPPWAKRGPEFRQGVGGARPIPARVRPVLAWPQTRLGEFSRNRSSTGSGSSARYSVPSSALSSDSGTSSRPGFIRPWTPDFARTAAPDPPHWRACIGRTLTAVGQILVRAEFDQTGNEPNLHKGRFQCGMSRGIDFSGPSQVRLSSAPNVGSPKSRRHASRERRLAANVPDSVPSGFQAWGPTPL